MSKENYLDPKINSNIKKVITEFEEFRKRARNIEDAIPFIQNEIVLDGIKPNIREDILGNSNINTKLPIKTQNTKQLKKLLESDHVLPIKQINQPKHPKLKNININSIKKPKKINIMKLKREIANLTINWLFKINI